MRICGVWSILFKRKYALFNLHVHHSRQQICTNAYECFATALQYGTLKREYTVSDVHLKIEECAAFFLNMPEHDKKYY